MCQAKNNNDKNRMKQNEAIAIKSLCVRVCMNPWKCKVKKHTRRLIGHFSGARIKGVYIFSLKQLFWFH